MPVILLTGFLGAGSPASDVAIDGWNVQIKGLPKR
jgi:hypothetical protein